MTADPVTIDRLDAGSIWRVTFRGPKGNVLDAAVIDALAGVFHEAGAETPLRAICLEGAGADFSFGASVEEHRPAEVAGMLRRFRGLLEAMLASSVVTVAAVRGRCLGGGLELACLCHRIIAAREATFGQPEINLGVVAPFASILLPERMGRGRAEDLLLTGRTIGADEALGAGLVDEIAEADPAQAAIAWALRHLSAKSASSLRFAVQAARAGLGAKLAADLPGVERLYLDRLMRTHDAVEGLEAFLAKRSAVWTHH